MTLVGTGLNLGEKMKIYPQLLTSFIKPQIWLFHVVVLQTTTKTKYANVDVLVAVAVVAAISAVAGKVSRGVRGHAPLGIFWI